MTRKRYSDTYKQSVVDKVVAGASASSVRKETGVSVTSIHQWVLAFEQSQRERPATPAEVLEIKILKKRIAELEEDKVILKKASALLAGWKP